MKMVKRSAHQRRIPSLPPRAAPIQASNASPLSQLRLSAGCLVIDIILQNCTPNNTPPHSEANANPPSQPKQARLGRVAPAQQIPSLHSDRLSAQPPIRLPPRLPAFPATPPHTGCDYPLHAFTSTPTSAAICRKVPELC